jgi:predicted adenine nucleotide alpha hydrolase (AANH) superfamily ATPase
LRTRWISCKSHPMQLLFHICCGPCAVYPLKLLKAEGIGVKGFFFNPNIHPFREFERRVEALETVVQRYDLEVLWDKAGYGLRSWTLEVGDRQEPPARCSVCYSIRLERTAARAAEMGMSAFSTTLLYSRYQNHGLIREIGEETARHHGVTFYYRDFRTGWQEGLEISRDLGLYRQPYCGCVYSEEERYAKRRRKLADRLFDSRV